MDDGHGPDPARDAFVIAVSDRLTGFAGRLLESYRVPSGRLQAEDTRVIVDLANVTFCDSTGIGALVRAQAEAAEQGTVMQIADPHPAVRRVLEVTCVLDTLTNPPPP